MRTRILVPALIVATAAVTAHAAPYRLTFAGQIDDFSDTRPVGSDLFAGTDLAAGMYTPSAGDVLSVSIDYDSDMFPDPGDPDSAIYSGLSWSMSLAGVTILGGQGGNMFFYYDDADQRRVLEIFGLFDPTPGLGGIAGVEFGQPNPIDGLINDGLLPTDAGVFDGLLSTDLFFLSNNGDFSVAASQFEVTIVPIPAPAPIGLGIAAGATAIARRRRG